MLFCIELAEASQNSSNRQQRAVDLIDDNQQQHDQNQHQHHGGNLLLSTAEDNSPPRKKTASAFSSSSASSISDQRQIDDWKLAEFLLIASVDGSLHACERDTGIERWSLDGEGSVVKAFNDANHDDADSDEDELTWIVEPLGDGALYYFTPNTGLQVCGPISIQDRIYRL